MGKKKLDSFNNFFFFFFKQNEQKKLFLILVFTISSQMIPKVLRHKTIGNTNICSSREQKSFFEFNCRKNNLS